MKFYFKDPVGIFYLGFVNETSHIENLFGLTTALEVAFNQDVEPKVCIWLVLV